MNDPLNNHKKIALQFSGGKDSLAVVYLMRPFWDRLTLYHVDTGDLLPEVLEVIKDTEKKVPNFIRIDTDSNEWRERVGYPSDLVPTSGTSSGVMIGLSDRRIVDRFDCCISNIMGPMHARMVVDGITLVIRGAKRADFRRMPAENGPTGLGYDLLLPLLEWSHDDVFAYLRSVGAPICRVYENKVNAPECATCTGWWNEGRAAYLGKYHPELFKEYKRKLTLVMAEITPALRELQTEIGGG